MTFNFSEEQIQQMREQNEQHKKRREAKEQRRQAFNKVRRAEVIEEILSILEKEEYVSETAIKHRPKDYPFSAEEFLFIVEPLIHYAKVFQLTFIGDDDPLEHTCCAVEIKGVVYIFEEMHGSGYHITNCYVSDEEDGTGEVDEEHIHYVLSYETFLKQKKHRTDKNLQTFFERFQFLLKEEEKTIETTELDKDLQLPVEEVLSIQQQLQEKVIALHETFYK